MVDGFGTFVKLLFLIPNTLYESGSTSRERIGSVGHQVVVPEDHRFAGHQRHLPCHLPYRTPTLPVPVQEGDRAVAAAVHASAGGDRNRASITSIANEIPAWRFHAA